MIYQFKEKVPIFCPVCAYVEIVKSLEQYVELLRMQWKQTLDKLPDSEEKRKIIMEIGMHNSYKRLRQILNEDGYLTGFCRSCITKISEYQMQKMGMNVIRVGNFIFDAKFFNENAKEIMERLYKK